MDSGERGEATRNPEAERYTEEDEASEAREEASRETEEIEAASAEAAGRTRARVPSPSPP